MSKLLDTNLPALVFIHGTLGSPNEFIPVVSYFKGLGYPCFTPSLPGHGEWLKSQVLDTLTYQDFIQSIDSYLNYVHSQHEQMVLVGHSLGGILALHYAASYKQHPGLLGLISLASALNQASMLEPYRLFKQPLTRLIKAVRYIPDYWHGSPKPRVRPRTLLHMRRESHKLFRSLETVLPELDKPILLAHSPYDLSVPYEQLDSLIRVLETARQCPRFERLDLIKCGHQIFPKSGEAERVLQHMERFITSLREQAA